MVLPIGILGLGTGVFGCFLSFYILSFSSFSDEYGTSVSFNEDYLILTLIGLFLAALGLLMLLAHLKKNKDERILWGGLLAIGTVSFVYALFMVVKGYVKGLSSTPFYWGWLFVSLLLAFLSLCFLLQKKSEPNR